MPIFKYRAADRSGKSRKGIIDAASRKQAVRKLRDQGLLPMDIVQTETAARETRAKGARLSLDSLHRVPKDAIAAITRQLATLLKAGLPLDESLDACIAKKGDTLQRIMSEVRESVREGEDFAGALARHPRVFGKTFVTIVRAGENSGTLDIVMERLADHMDQQIALRRKIQATMAYPALMLVVGVCVVIFLLSFVVPKVTEIFFDMERALPLPTRILLGASDLFSAYWPLMILAVCAAGLGLHRLTMHDKGRKAFHAFLLRVPLLGEVFRLISIGSLTKTLAMLLKNGVSLDTALTIVLDVSGNEVLKEVTADLHQAAHEGRRLSEPLESSSMFDHASVQMIAAGERSGRLDDMLLLVANSSESKVDARLQMLTSLMEPVMILFIGGLVGFVVMAIMLPIFEMSNLVGG
ncbi:type II secretion system F family protein [Salidesulfovibrio onnuriiensis]|uniref:type II secretion system F family protein n=1 Tax=Salidesulfovibrio onnuriiensis TaxID=2583823 RepID=UPI0016501D66|nr:type II secretion system F family protein [Salidesulfovibrio onnuriiensis]